MFILETFAGNFLLESGELMAFDVFDFLPKALLFEDCKPAVVTTTFLIDLMLIIQKIGISIVLGDMATKAVVALES